MESKKNRIYDIVVIACIYLLANGVPFSLFIKNEHISFLCNSLLLICFIVYYFYYIKKYNFDKPSTSKIHAKYLLFIPFLLLAFSNFFYSLITNSPSIKIKTITIIEGLINCILVATCEELVFRGIIVKEFLRNNNKLKSILLSSVVFGLVHLLNISSFASIPSCLIQCCYSFFLGLFLSTMYVYSKNIILPIILHFSFNFINDKLTSNLFNYPIELDYYIYSVVFGIIMFIYLVIIYFIFRKDEIDYVS